MNLAVRTVICSSDNCARSSFDDSKKTDHAGLARLRESPSRLNSSTTTPSDISTAYASAHTPDICAVTVIIGSNAGEYAPRAFSPSRRKFAISSWVICVKSIHTRTDFPHFDPTLPPKPFDRPNTPTQLQHLTHEKESEVWYAGGRSSLKNHRPPLLDLIDEKQKQTGRKCGQKK